MPEDVPSAGLPENLRAEFACLRGTPGNPPLVYLDSAATALKPDRVIAALEAAKASLR